MTQEQLFREWIARQPSMNVGNLDYALKDDDSIAWLMFQAFKAGRRIERSLMVKRHAVLTADTEGKS